LEYNFDNERPIYLQLIDLLRIEIISGKLKKGEKIPSVRDLSLSLKVNPNTLQKALMELEKQKLIYTERTNGKFVTEDSNLIEQVKREIAKEKVNNYLNSMKSIGLSFEESMKYLKELGGKDGISWM